MKKTKIICIKSILFMFLLSLLLVMQVTVALAAKKPTKVKLNKSKVTLTVGDQYKLTATVKPTTGNVDRTVTWTSSDKTIVSVNKKGKLTAKKAGTATITVKTINGKKATCKVKVNKPKIRIAVVDTSQGSDCQNLINCVRNCGADVDFISSVKVDASKYDGLMIPGGNDIAPSTYNSSNQGSVNTNAAKDAMQKKVIKKFIKADKPIFGICRGMQMINVYFGGTLNQDIQNHRGAMRTVSISRGSLLYEVYGKSESVYHTHHQSCMKLGTGLKITQMDKQDGTIEAIEHTKYMIYGVQWHPELMGSRGRKTINTFLSVCEKNRDEQEDESGREETTTTSDQTQAVVTDAETARTEIAKIETTQSEVSSVA